MFVQEQSRTEVVIFAEFIKNDIHDKLSRIHEKCAETIDCTISADGLGFLNRKSLAQMVDSLVVQPYTTCIRDIVDELNKSVSQYFGLESGCWIAMDESHLHSLFTYRINHTVMKELHQTEQMADLTQKLIDKAMDITFLTKTGDSLLKKFVSPLSVGSLLMAAVGLDNSAHIEQRKRELGKTLKGISKNFMMRIKRLFTRQYISFIYQLTEQIQKAHYYYEAIS